MTAAATTAGSDPMTAMSQTASPSRVNNSLGCSRFEIVAAIVTHRDLVCMFRRSIHVQGDRGCWHCITGFLPVRVDVVTQAVREISGEAGISDADLRLLAQDELQLSSLVQVAAPSGAAHLS